MYCALIVPGCLYCALLGCLYCDIFVLVATILLGIPSGCICDLFVLLGLYCDVLVTMILWGILICEAMDWVWDTFGIVVPLFDCVTFTFGLVIDHLFICVVSGILGIVFLNCCVSFGLCGAVSFEIMLGLWDWICLVIGGTGGDF